MKLRLRRPVPAARRSALALAVAATTLGLAGCSVFSPATVLKPYEPSDGSGAVLQGVQIRNALVVSSAVDEPGVLSVTLVNSTQEDASVEVAVDVAAGTSSGQSFLVPAGGVVQIGDPSAADGTTPAADTAAGNQVRPGWVQIPQVPVVPGQTVPVTFGIGGESTELAAPVVLPCFEYAPITPTPVASATASPTPSASVTCGPALGEEGLLPDQGEG